MVSMIDVVEGRERSFVALADCRFAMQGMPADSVDLCCTDPPYGLSEEPDVTEVLSAWLRGEEYEHKASRGFMNKEWDAFVPGPEYFREIYRVLKPGAFLFCFGGTRTWDLVSIAIRMSGFEIRDTIRLDGPSALGWTYSSGFPKSLDVAKAIDAHLGVEPTVVGWRTLTGSAALSTKEKGGTFASATSSHGRSKEVPVTVPTSPEAKDWNGYGTALKPSWEPIIVARKPLNGTVAANVLAHRTGAFNIDRSRVFTDWNEPDRPDSWKRSGHSAKPDAEKIAAPPGDGIDLHPGGRWPPNLLLQHAAECVRVGTKRVEGTNPAGPSPGQQRGDGFGHKGGRGPIVQQYHDGDGLETVSDWRCVPGCPVRRIEEGAGEPVSRFFPQFQLEPDAPFKYCGKVARSERDAGLDDFPASTGAEATDSQEGQARLDSPRTGAGRTGGAKNTHPSVKPEGVLRWLIRLGGPPGALVFDPFVGSGSTGRAAMLEAGRYRFLGIDRDPGYVAFAEARIRHVIGGGYRTQEERATAAALPEGAETQLALF